MLVLDFGLSGRQ